MERALVFIVVDDEQTAIDDIVEMAARFQNCVVKATFTDPADGLAYLKKHHVDFVLLDMEMPGIDGEAFLLQMPKEVKVILYTAHSEYASNGFDHDAVDFLTKPVSVERFAKAIQKMARVLKFETMENPNLKGDYYYFMLKGPNKNMRTRIFFDELVYVESYLDKCYLYLAGDIERPVPAQANEWELAQPCVPGTGRVSSERLSDLLQILSGPRFKQIHRSYVLNTDYYRGYYKHEVLLKGLGIKLPVGKRANYPDFFDWTQKSNFPDR